MSGIDVYSYQDIESARALARLDEEALLGRTKVGPEVGVKSGDGMEYYGVRDYEPGDEARTIDWLHTAARTDGGITVREFHAEQASLTVLVSDIPTYERYAATPGTALTAQALGFVAANTLLKAYAVGQQADILAYWTNGYRQDRSQPVMSGYAAARRSMEAGLRVAVQSKQRYEQTLELSQQKRGFFKKVATTQEAPEPNETLAQAIETARGLSSRFADVARFIIVSDFREKTAKTIDAMKKLQGMAMHGTEVLTVQITNPRLRELPDIAAVYGNGRRASVIEVGSQRQAYAEASAKKQAMINQNLRRYSKRTVILDTI